MKKDLTPLEAVRKRPGMYVGILNDQALIGLIKNLMTSVISLYHSREVEIELFNQNSIQLTFKEVQKSISTDHSILFNKNTADLRMDIPILNYLSERFTFTLMDERSISIEELNFEKGELKKGIVNNKPIACKELKLFAKLDTEIWKDKLKWNESHFIREINEFAYLNKNVKITLKYKVDDEDCKIIYKCKNGLEDWLEIIKLTGYGKSYFQTYIEHEEENLYFEIAFAFRELTIDEAIIKSFVNDFYTFENGSHVDGLLKGVTYGVMKHFQKHNLVNKYKISEKGMEQSLVALISVRMNNASYSGCVKNKLAIPEIIPIIANKVSEVLFKKIEDDEKSTERLIRRFEM